MRQPATTPTRCRTVVVMVETHAVPGFLPRTHALHFANRFPPGPTLRLGPFDPRWFRIGDAANGLCGGMAWYVRDCFEGGLPIPVDTTPPTNGSALFQALVQRQLQSLDWLRTPIRFWWIGAFGVARAVRRSRGTEWPRIRARIDAGRLAMVGLIRHQGPDPLRLTRNHQVLAYGYTLDGPTVRLRVYDPNWPNRDDIVVVIECTRVHQSTGELLFGVLALD